MTKGKDPFLSMVQKAKEDKTQKFKDALLFAKSEAHTDSGRRFVKSCETWFKEKGFLTDKQVAGLYRVDSTPYIPNEEYYDEYGEYPDEDSWFDPFDP